MTPGTEPMQVKKNYVKCKMALLQLKIYIFAMFLAEGDMQ